MRTRRAFLLYIDLDPMPGMMHSPENAKNHIRRTLEEFFRSYNPIISQAPASAQLPYNPDAMKTRKTYIIFIDLDAVPGVMHIEESALMMLNRVFGSIFTNYDPNVVVAPDYLQPQKGI